MLSRCLKGSGLSEPVSIPDSPDNTRHVDDIFPDDAGNGHDFELHDHTAPKHERKTQHGLTAVHELDEAP